MLTFLEIAWLVLCAIGMVVALFIVSPGQAVAGAVLSYVVGHWMVRWLFAPTRPALAVHATALGSHFPMGLAWGLVLIVACVVFFFVWGFAEGFLQAMLITPVLFMIGAVVIDHFVKGLHA